jgi:gamma-glutamyltranspeptidase / glutathione hydrolase
MMPPPSSSGVVMATAFSLIQKLELDKRKFLSVDELHLLGEILSRSFRGRSLLGDPDFYKNPIGPLTSDTFLTDAAKSIDPKKTIALKPISPAEFPKEIETTHYSIMDSKGNAVALTVTLNGNYGSGVVSEKFGIALNNEMDDFTTKLGEANMYGLVQGEGNKVEPGKRPLSSMSPTLVEKDGQIMMTVGAPGGPRIISSVLQVIYRALVNGMDVDAAIQAPRIHHQFSPHVLFVDAQKLSPDVLDLLRQRGHTVEESWVAKVYAVKRNASGWLEGSHDSRGEGATGGF